VAGAHTGTPAFETSTTARASAVPAMDGLGATCALCAGLVMSGAAGAVVSMVMVRVVDATPVLPAVSVAVAVTASAPSGCAWAVQLQLPPALTTAVQTSVEPFSTRTVA